jgi:hypothetical protein
VSRHSRSPQQGGGQRRRRLMIAVRKQDRELVATDPGDEP